MEITLSEDLIRIAHNASVTRRVYARAYSDATPGDEASRRLVVNITYACTEMIAKREITGVQVTCDKSNNSRESIQKHGRSIAIAVQTGEWPHITVITINDTGVNFQVNQ